MNNYLASNLKILSEKYTVKEIAKKTGISQSSINAYITGTREPSIKFLVQLKEQYDINIDEFMFLDLKTLKNIENELTIASRFCGNYICYYYNNKEQLGKLHESIKDLYFGIMSISVIGRKVKVYATFSKEKHKVIEDFKFLNSQEDFAVVEEYHKKADDHYIGELNYTQEHVFINLSCKEKNDHAFIIFKNPASKTKYAGGIATINSISRGSHNPCVQFILLSRKVIKRPDGDIYNRLTMKGVDVNLGNIVTKIINIVKEFYCEEESSLNTNFSDEQKKIIIESIVKHEFDKIVESNKFRFGKISDSEDALFYQLIKEEEDYEN